MPKLQEFIGLKRNSTLYSITKIFQTVRITLFQRNAEQIVELFDIKKIQGLQLMEQDTHKTMLAHITLKN